MNTKSAVTKTDRDNLSQLAESNGWEVTQGYGTATFEKNGKRIFANFHRFGAFRWAAFGGGRTIKMSDVDMWLSI